MSTTSTVTQLKTDVFAAIAQGVILTPADTRDYESFDTALDAFVSSYAAISLRAIPAARTRHAWLRELTAIN